MTTCVILQPSYIPWLGFFDLINCSDVFIHYDDVQYDKHGWRNRNRLKFPTKTDWVSVPVSLPGGSLSTLILEALISDEAWVDRHHRAIEASLGEAEHFQIVSEELLSYIGPRKKLVDLTIPIIEAVSGMLEIQTQFLRSSELGISGRRTERLVRICAAVGADTYLSGPSARAYLDEGIFAAAGIRVEWMEYRLNRYPQLHGEFDPYVSVLDPLANLGITGVQELLHSP